MNHTIETETRTREFIRWMILRMLYACQPGAASETIILRVLQSLDFQCGLDDVRQDLDYLRSIGVAETGGRRVASGRVRLTPLGVAVVEYNTRAPSGIGRPRRSRGSAI